MIYVVNYKAVIQLIQKMSQIQVRCISFLSKLQIKKKSFCLIFNSLFFDSGHQHAAIGAEFHPMQQCLCGILRK